MFIANKTPGSVVNLVLKSEISGNIMFQQLPDQSWKVGDSEAGKHLKWRCDEKFFFFFYV